MRLDATRYPAAAQELPWFRDLIDGTNAAEAVPAQVRELIALILADRAADVQGASDRRRAEEREVMEMGVPRTDGLYVDERYVAYVRFYADGRVVCVASTGTPGQVANWLGWGRADADERGQFTLRGLQIEFDSGMGREAVEYRGTFNSRDQITMDTYSHINGFRANDRVFTFVPTGFKRP